DLGKKIGLDIPKSFKPEKLLLKGYVGYIKGRLKGPIDLVAHPVDNTKASLKILKPIGKLVITHMDLCDTIDKAHLLDPVTYQQQINHLEQQISEQVDAINTAIVDGVKAFFNLSVEDKAYLFGHMRGQCKFKNSIKSLGLRGISKLFSSTKGAENLEHFQYLAAAMRGAKPIHTYHAKNIIYTVYDNGAVFAGAKHGNIKKIWCISPPKNASSINPVTQLSGRNSLQNVVQSVGGNTPNALARLGSGAANTAISNQSITPADTVKPATKLTQAAKELLREQKNIEFCNKLLTESNDIKSLLARYDTESVRELVHLSIQCKDILITENMTIDPEILRELDLISGPVSEINTDPRWRDFKVDVATGFKPSLKKIKEEAIPAWLCEKKKLTGNLYRFKEKEGRADFLEHTLKGTIHWDVKTFRSYAPNKKYIFNAATAIESIKDGLQAGENLIINTTYTELNDIASLLEQLNTNFSKSDLEKIIFVNLKHAEYCKSSINLLNIRN
ncbi:MAG: hypothetical protein ACOYT8_01550, partial [Candidatus Dependentiae bacterium]